MLFPFHTVSNSPATKLSSAPSGSTAPRTTSPSTWPTPTEWSSILNRRPSTTRSQSQSTKGEGFPRASPRPLRRWITSSIRCWLRPARSRTCLWVTWWRQDYLAETGATGTEFGKLVGTVRDKIERWGERGHRNTRNSDNCFSIKQVRKWSIIF